MRVAFFWWFSPFQGGRGMGGVYPPLPPLKGDAQSDAGKTPQPGRRPPFKGVPEGRGIQDPQSPMPQYTFTAKTTDYESRFKLVFCAKVPELVEGPNQPFAFISNGNIIVNGTGTVQVIDVMGRIVHSGNAKHCVSTTGMAPGVYVLRLIDGDDVKVQKMVIR